MISLAEALTILESPDPDHVCIGCDGLSQEERMGCFQNGVNLTGEETLQLREYIESSFNRLIQAEALSCENTRGEGCCPMSPALVEERNINAVLIATMKKTGYLLIKTIKNIEEGVI